MAIAAFFTGKTVPQEHRQDLYLHVVPPQKGPEPALSSTAQKVLMIASYILISLGLSLLIGGAGFLGIGTAMSGAVFGLSHAEVLFPLGLASVMGGCQLLQASEKGSAPKISSMNLGPFKLELGA